MFESRRRRSNGNKTDYEKEFFTIEALESGYINVDNDNFEPYTNPVYYSKNGGAWVGSTKYVSVTVVSGDKVRFKTVRTSDSVYITCDTQFDVYGNIMSLIYGDNFIGQTSVFSAAFQYMFANSSVRDASNLILPATTLSSHCYFGMFSRCTSLTTAPELPATTLSSHCYYGMFEGCTNLTTAPELPATTLSSYCYHNMFSYCTSLITAPELPAFTMTDYCYAYMFSDCTNLTTAPELPATTLGEACYAVMFSSCRALTTAPELPATVLAEMCYYNMFSRCTSLTTAPELPATTLAEYCYQYMFQDCTKLSEITMLATDISANSCLWAWVDNVASTGTFTKAPSMTSLPIGKTGIPKGWIVKNSDGSPVPGGGGAGANIMWSVQTGDWTESSNSSAYDGKQFTSVSPGSNGSTRLRCTFSGVTSITFNCVYNGESSYDYLTVGNLDSTCTRDSYGTTLKGTSGTAKDITFSCDSGTHYVEFCYSKDGSVDTSPDCAVVYIKNCS